MSNHIDDAREELGDEVLDLIKSHAATIIDAAKFIDPPGRQYNEAIRALRIHLGVVDVTENDEPANAKLTSAISTLDRLVKDEVGSARLAEIIADATTRTWNRALASP